MPFGGWRLRDGPAHARSRSAGRRQGATSSAGGGLAPRVQNHVVGGSVSSGFVNSRRHVDIQRWCERFATSRGSGRASRSAPSRNARRGFALGCISARRASGEEALGGFPSGSVATGPQPTCACPDRPRTSELGVVAPKTSPLMPTARWRVWLILKSLGWEGVRASVRRGVQSWCSASALASEEVEQGTERRSFRHRQAGLRPRLSRAPCGRLTPSEARTALDHIDPMTLPRPMPPESMPVVAPLLQRTSRALVHRFGVCFSRPPHFAPRVLCPPGLSCNPQVSSPTGPKRAMTGPQRLAAFKRRSPWGHWGAPSFGSRRAVRATAPLALEASPCPPAAS